MCCVTELAGDGEEVNVALERLAAKQKRRQYSATNVSSDVLSSASATQCSASDITDPVNTASQPCKPKRVQSAYSWTHRSSAATRRRKEMDPAELDDCEESADPKRDPKRVNGIQHRQSLVSRRREGTDSTEGCEDSENPKHARRWSSAAARHGTDPPSGVDANYYENQRCMIEESRALLEQSKAKHHALVAQAHSMQKKLRSHQLAELPVQQSESQTSLTPKPPPAPSADKKPTSSFRTQRLARYDLLALLDNRYSQGAFHSEFLGS